MYPESMPVFISDDILISETEYESDDGRKTTVGWLKELFLFSKPTADHLWITEEDRKVYKIALDKFKKVNTMNGNADLHEWEEKTTAKHQAACLNALRKSLGYTVIVEQ
jgi:predicted RNA-binding protein (virulence factor B family)